ncbi:MAG TPA: DUF3488 and transglutaminase-like domain-containing protein, partial [Acidimicrobiales bacterium]
MLTAPPADPARRAPSQPIPASRSMGARPQPAPPRVDGFAGATVALALLTIISVAGLVRVFSGHQWLPPVLIMVTGVYTVCWATRRARLPRLVALALDLAAVWALAGWTTLGSSTNFGFPGGRTATQLWSALAQARLDFANAVTPAAATQGFKLAVVLAAGLVAVVADWVAFRWRSALYGAVAPLAYFVACCALGQGSGREWAVTSEVAGLLLFLLVHRSSVGRADQAWFGNHRAGTARWALTAGAIAGAASLLAAVAITPAVSATEGRGILGWRGGFGQAGSGPRQVPNPIVDLHTRLLNLSDTPVFQVQSAVPSYWRLTSLDTFTGQDWVSTNSYRSFGNRLPGIQAVPPGTRVVQENFTVQQLDSVWLPDAFTPVAVSGVRNVSYDPTSGSLITSHSTSDGLAYSVDAYQFLSNLDPAQLQSAPPVTLTSSLRHYLQLPGGIPTRVYKLANSIVAGQTTEYGKALALQNFFLGPQFSYDLSPVDDGYGINALTNFLFNTQSGYCQQFAGSYAVLARMVGLPTRLAVGFATGTAQSNDIYQVTNAQAHTWPEVYFGPAYGWLPFEPTKSYDDPNSANYAPPPAAGTESGPTNSPGPLPPSPKGSGNLTHPAPGKGVTATTVGSATAGPASSHGHSTVWVGLLLLLAAAIVWSGLVAAYRRARWGVRRWQARHDPGALVRSHWADVMELLNWWGAGREPGQTDDEFA